MKKLYTILLAALCSAGAAATELTFWIGNQKITPGTTVAFDEMTVNDLGTYKEVTMDPGLSLSTNIFSSDITITATCQSGQTIRMCAGGSCKGGESVTKDNVTIATGQKLPLEFEGEFLACGDRHVVLCDALSSLAAAAGAHAYRLAALAGGGDCDVGGEDVGRERQPWIHCYLFVCSEVVDCHFVEGDSGAGGDFLVSDPECQLRGGGSGGAERREQDGVEFLHMIQLFGWFVTLARAACSTAPPFFRKATAARLAGTHFSVAVFLRGME